MNLPRLIVITLTTILGTFPLPALAETIEFGPKILLEQSDDGTLYVTRRSRSDSPSSKTGPLNSDDFYAAKVRISGRGKVKGTYVTRQEVFVLDQAGHLWTIDKSAAYYKARLFLRNVGVLAVPFGISLMVDQYGLIQDPYFAGLFHPQTVLGSYMVMALVGMLAPPPSLVGAFPTFDGFNFFHTRVASFVGDVTTNANGDYDVVIGGPRPRVVRLSSFIKQPRLETCQDWLQWW